MPRPVLKRKRWPHVVVRDAVTAALKQFLTAREIGDLLGWKETLVEKRIYYHRRRTS